MLGIPRAFSHGIRAGNAVRLQLGVKFAHYSGYYKAAVVADIHSDRTRWLMDKEAEYFIPGRGSSQSIVFKRKTA